MSDDVSEVPYGSGPFQAGGALAGRGGSDDSAEISSDDGEKDVSHPAVLISAGPFRSGNSHAAC